MANLVPIVGVARIKNVSGSPYAVEELPGVTIQDQAEIDLLDQELSSYYDDFETVKRLVTELETAKLHQDIVAGNIEVVELKSVYPTWA